MLHTLMNKFWDDNFWLPLNTTWQDLASGPDKPVAYNDPVHLLYPLPLALVLLLLRHILEKYCFGSLGKSLGVESARPKRAPNNPKLEAAYQTSSNIKHKQKCALAKQLDMSERQVERWWRLRRSQDKPSTLVKFCENGWKATFFICEFTFGLFILWDKDWLWDIDYCYIGFPHQGNTNGVWWYYMMASAYYWSLTFSQFWDVRRKDFWQMIVHHFAANSLVAVSWVSNLHRIGTLVILSHDSSEIFLEVTKALKYAGYQRLCDCLFAVFTLIWIVTRLGYYPFYIIWSTFARAPVLMPMFPACYNVNFPSLFAVRATFGVDLDDSASRIHNYKGWSGETVSKHTQKYNGAVSLVDGPAGGVREISGTPLISLDPPRGRTAHGSTITKSINTLLIDYAGTDQIVRI